MRRWGPRTQAATHRPPRYPEHKSFHALPARLRFAAKPLFGTFSSPKEPKTHHATPPRLDLPPLQLAGSASASANMLPLQPITSSPAPILLSLFSSHVSAAANIIPSAASTTSSASAATHTHTHTHSRIVTVSKHKLRGPRDHRASFAISLYTGTISPHQQPKLPHPLPSLPLPVSNSLNTTCKHHPGSITCLPRFIHSAFR